MTAIVFPAFRTTDAERFGRFLEAAGFREVLTVPGETPGTVAHAEYALGDHGGIMFGSLRGDGDDLEQTVGRQSVYVVVGSDAEVDALAERMRAHPGVTIVRGPEAVSHGGREVDLTDPDGNRWGFGSYRGAAGA